MGAVCDELDNSKLFVRGYVVDDFPDVGLCRIMGVV
jgi:hypothetical protein